MPPSHGRPQDFFQGVIGGGRGQWLGGGTMASAEHEPITGSGAEPPAGSRGRARDQGVRGAKPPEAESILVIGCPTAPANLTPFQKCICISTLGARVQWEKFMSKSTVGQVTSLAPSWGRPCPQQTVHILFLANDRCLRDYDLLSRSSSSSSSKIL